MVRPRHPGGGGPGGGLRGGGMGGNGVGLDSGGGSRGASFGGLGMRAIFSPFRLVHPKHDAQLRPRGGFAWCILVASRLRPPLQACFDQLP